MRHLLQLHFLVVLFASTALIGRMIGDVHPVAIVAWRTALAALGAGLWIAFVQRRPLLLPRRRILQLLGIGAIVGLHWIAFFLSIQLSNASICLVGLASISLFTAFTEPWIERTPLRRSEVALGGLVLLGIVLITSSLLTGLRHHFLPGLLVALLSALLAAIFPVLNRRLVITGGSPQTMLFWEMIGACLVSLLVLPAFRPAPASLLPSPSAFAWLLALAWLCTVFAHGYHIHLLRHLSAYTSNLAINFEPVYGHLAAALLFHENHDLSPLFYLGFLTIVAANLLHLRFQSPPA